MEPLESRRCAAPGVDVLGLPPAARFVLRAGEAAAAAVGDAWPLPATMLSAAGNAARTGLRLGPDEWLLIGPDGTGPAIERAFAALAEPHSLVDVSHRQVGLLIEGAAAEALLASGCPLDLSSAAFPLGRCTRTVLGKVEVTLWRTAPEAFRVEVWRSYAEYLWRFLEDAARDL